MFWTTNPLRRGPLAAAAVMAALVPFLGHGAAFADWPMRRHDAHRTAIGDNPSELARPAPAWRYYLGGALDGGYTAYDVDGDGGREILYVVGGRLVAKTPQDIVVYESAFLDLSRIEGIVDLSGDGVDEIVVNANGGELRVLSLQSGEVLWSLPPDAVGSTVGAVRFADFNRDGVEDLYLADAACGSIGQIGGAAFAYSFASGFDNPALLFQLENGRRDYNCGWHDTIVDLDGDGQLEVFVLGDQRVYAYSGEDGQLLYQSENLGALRYGAAFTRIVDVDGDGDDEVIGFSNNHRGPAPSHRRVFLIDHDAATGALVMRWQRAVDDSSEDRHGFGVTGVDDLDGDGRVEVVTSFYEGSTGAWTTEVLDAATGALLESAPVGPFQGLVDLTGDGRPEIVTGDADSSLYVMSFDGAIMDVLRSYPQMQAVVVRDWSRVRESSRTRLQALDVAGDTRAELVALQVVDHSQKALVALSVDEALPVAQLAVPDGVSFTGFESHAGVGVAYERMLLLRSDGYLSLLDDSLQASSVEGPGVLPGLRIGGYFGGHYGAYSHPPIIGRLGNQSDVSVLVRNSSQAMESLDISDANLVQAPTQRWSIDWAKSARLVGHDQRQTILVRHEPGAHEIVLLDADGETIWAQQVGDWQTSVIGDVLVDDWNGDGVEDFAYMLHNGSSASVSFRVLDGANPDHHIWISEDIPTVGAGTPSLEAIWDIDQDGVRDVLVRAPASRLRWLSGWDGTTIIGPITHGYGRGVLYDVDGDNAPEIFATASYNAPRVLELDLTSLWIDDTDDQRYGHHFGAIIPCATGPRAISPIAYSTRVEIRDAATGVMLGDISMVGGQLHNPYDTAPALPGWLGNVTVSPDLTGAGKPAALIPSTDGHLYAFDACQMTLLWAYDFRWPVGEAVLADTDGDGLDEIVVTVQDGYIYALDTEVVPAPAFVVENDGSGPASGPGQDVDQVETWDTLWANWPSVEGATGYEYAVMTPGGTFVTEPAWIPVGDALQVEARGLGLLLGQRYLFAVRATNQDGSSSEALSDGVVIVDESPPQVSFSELPAVLEVPGSPPGSVTVTARLSDARSVTEARWRIESAQAVVRGSTLVSELRGPVHELALSWDGTDDLGALVAPGLYRLVVTAVDEMGHEATESKEIEVRLAPEVPTPPGSISGCGCAAGGGLESGVLAGLLLILLLLPAGRRQQRALGLGRG